MIKKFTLLILLIFISFNTYSQSWDKNKYSENHKTFVEPMPVAYTFFHTSRTEITGRLNGTPYRFDSQVSPVYLTFPVDNQGNTESFNMFETRYMEPELRRKFPRIKTYTGKSKSGKNIYLTITPYEITGVILRPGQPTYLVKQYADDTWIGFNSNDQFIPEAFVCQTGEEQSGNTVNTQERPAFYDGIMRKYRYAVAVTGEYSQYQLNRLGIPSTATEQEKKNAVLGAIATAVTRQNSIYERDFAISLMLVNNNDQIIFLDASNDPYDNGTPDMSVLLSGNQSTVDNHIGSSNYDVSLVWCKGNLQGLARLTAVCSNFKASGAARGSYPETDRFIVSVASHELGHMFGAYHVFYNSCGGNRTDDHAVETGSGTTIMAYAGICAPNIQNWTDDRFNYVSIKDFRSALSSTGGCAQTVNLNNQAPLVNAGPDRYIPKKHLLF
jgi:hypothetical protein